MQTDNEWNDGNEPNIRLTCRFEYGLWFTAYSLTEVAFLGSERILAIFCMYLGAQVFRATSLINHLHMCPECGSWCVVL